MGVSHKHVRFVSQTVSNMARKLNLLTVLEVKNAVPSATPNTPKLLSDGGGLYLQITPSGSKSYLFRYTFGRKAQTIGLGPFQTVGLAEARDVAQKYRSLVLKGMDPKVEKDRENARRFATDQKVAVGDEELHTFKWCAEQYVEAHKDEWRNEKHIQQWRQTLVTYVYPHLGTVPVKDIDVHLVMAVLKPIWKEKTATATRVRGRMERILGWSEISGYRNTSNPARWRAHLSELLPKPQKVSKVVHHPAIPHAEIDQFFVELHKLPDSISKRALKFLTLTAARTGEVIGATWSEFDFEEKTWTVPADRTKAHRVHVIPLCARAIEIVQGIKHLPDDEFVFRGLKLKTHISNMAMLQLMRRMKYTAVPHGMRSSFRDWAADMTDYPRELAEAALAHVVADKTEAAYLRSNRLDRRRAMMDAWALYCSTPRAANGIENGPAKDITKTT